MATGSADIALGIPAPDFRLVATDGRTYALKDVPGGKGTVIVLIGFIQPESEHRFRTPLEAKASRCASRG